MLDRLEGRRAAARRAARRPARGLPARHPPLRPRLPALLRRRGRGRRRADDGRVARRHRPVRRARRRQLRVHRRRPAAARRLRRAGRPHHRARTRPRRASSSTAWSTRRWPAELSRAGRGLLTPLASIDGPREINDALRGPGSYDDVMASIANLLAVGLEPVANTVLVRPALPGLPQLARELRAAGVGRLHLILPHQRGMACGPSAATGGGRRSRADRRGAAARPCASCSPSPARSASPSTTCPSWRRRSAGATTCAPPAAATSPSTRPAACTPASSRPATRRSSPARCASSRSSEIWRTSSSLRLLRAARARDRAECLACPVADACGGECWVQAHYAARARGEAAGYAAPFPYCDLVRPLLEELARPRRPRPRPPPRPATTASPPAPAAASPRPAPTTTPSSTASEATDGAGVTRATAPPAGD